MTFALQLAYLVLAGLLIPTNLWAAITPHLHSELSMRILHGVSSATLVPLLVALGWQRRGLQQAMALLLTIFLSVMLVVNVWITLHGMGVAYGWLDHLLLALASASVVAFFLLKPEAA